MTDPLLQMQGKSATKMIIKKQSHCTVTFSILYTDKYIYLAFSQHSF